MRKRLYILAILFIFYTSVSSQSYADWPDQDFLFFTVNPAMAGDISRMTLGVTHSRRWRNIRSSPTQSNFGILFPFRQQKMALASQIFSDKLGPITNTGFDLAYAYKFSVFSSKDHLSLGVSMRVMQVNFDLDHLVVSTINDPLFDNIDDRQPVPPSFNVGFSYTTGDADLNNPVQIRLAVSASQFLPFEDRFNTLSFERNLQWHSFAGLLIATSETIYIEPGIFIRSVTDLPFDYAFRIKTTHQKYGWLMAQCSKAGFISTQVGIQIGENWQSASVFNLSIGNSWYFGNLSGQPGNRLTFGFSYSRP